MKRAAIVRAGALGVVLGIVLLTIELGLRMAEPPSPEPTQRPAELADLPELTHVFALAAPDQRGVYAGVLHETNAFGLRNRATTREKPAGRFRIVAFGDSLMMGQGVEVQDRYMDRVETALREVAGVVPRDLEVVNIGLAGLSLRQSVDRLERNGLSFDPDLLVYGFAIDDIEGDGYQRFRDVSPSAAQLDPVLPSSRMWGLLEAAYGRLRELVAPPVDAYVHELDHNYFENAEAWEAFTGQLDRLREIADRRGLCTVVFIQPRLFHLHAWHPLRPHYDAVALAARERGFQVVESLHRFEGEDPETLWAAPGDLHPNERGHCILAEALLDGLLSLPDRCWTAGGREE